MQPEKKEDTTLLSKKELEKKKRAEADSFVKFRSCGIEEIKMKVMGERE